MIKIYTARISTKDPDRYNVSYRSGDSRIAPVPNLVWMYKKGKMDWACFVRYYVERLHTVGTTVLKSILEGKERIVLTCYCTDPTHCHRVILAKYLAYNGLGEYCGELEE